MNRRDFMKASVGAAAVSDSTQTLSRRQRQLVRLAKAGTPANWAFHCSRGKWQYARHLQILNYYLSKCERREITRLMVFMPPRHGKSKFISQFFSSHWLGMFPDEQVIITSYGADLAAFWSAKSREVMTEFGQECFGVQVNTKTRAGDDWSILGREGGMKSAGVRGAITGRGANLLIIDDPVKNAEEARSRTMRENNWEWLNSTAYTRLEPNSVCVIVQTRWHEDDMSGRILTEMEVGGEKWVILNLPAIAEEDEEPFPISMGRKRGEALWPERYNVESLERIRKKVGEYWWNSLYQQNPHDREGSIFKREVMLNAVVRSHPTIISRCRFWDLASTAASQTGDPDYTAGSLWGQAIDMKKYVMDLRVGRWGPQEVFNSVVATAKIDGPATRVVIEQEPGASSPIVINRIAAALPGYSVFGVKPDGSKEVRAESLAVDLENGNVKFFAAGEASWIHTAIQQLITFPTGAHDDIVDSFSGGYNFLTFRGSMGAGATAKTERFSDNYRMR